MRDFQIAINLLRDGLVDHKCMITPWSAMDTAMSKGSEGVGQGGHGQG